MGPEIEVLVLTVQMTSPVFWRDKRFDIKGLRFTVDSDVDIARFPEQHKSTQNTNISNINLGLLAVSDRSSC